MKILWVTNVAIGNLATAHGIKLTSGQWLNAELENEKQSKQNEIIVCTSGPSPKEIIADNIKYVMLPHGNVSDYAVTDKHIDDWKRLFKKERPDIILVWGTEYDIGKCALIANNKEISSIIYIQGVMCSIAENYRGGLSDKEIKLFTTLVERFRKTSVFDIEQRQQKRAIIEKECIMLSDGVILENNWAETQYRKISPELKIFRSRLPIKKDFSQYNWTEDAFERHSIVTTAANYPLKGLHKLIEAINILKETYPDIKLYVPGPNNVTVNGFKAKLSQSGYCKKISHLIKVYKLKDNIIFTGPLTTQQYAERMQKSNIFVTASAIENHCSALREAMSVGVPCISSRVGGIPEYAIDRENCSLYNYCDFKQMAVNIAELFENAGLRKKYSKNGKKTIHKMYTENNLMTLDEVYKEIVNV